MKSARKEKNQFFIGNSGSDSICENVAMPKKWIALFFLFGKQKSLNSKINQICATNVVLTWYALSIEKKTIRTNHTKHATIMWTSITLGSMALASKHTCECDEAPLHCTAFEWICRNAAEKKCVLVAASVRVVHNSNMEKDEEIIMLHLCGT